MWSWIKRNWPFIWRIDRDIEVLELKIGISDANARIASLKDTVAQLLDREKVHFQQCQAYYRAQKQAEEDIETVKQEFRHKCEQFNETIDKLQKRGHFEFNP